MIMNWGVISMKRLQRGDTIIEVMLAMAIIGAVLGAAFGIANRNMQIAQTSKERTEALKLAESQIELLKAGYEADSSIVSSAFSQGFCMRYDGSTIQALPAEDASQCPKQGLYTIRIDKPDPLTIGSPYVVQITWDRIGTSSTEPGNVTLYYKLIGS